MATQLKPFLTEIANAIRTKKGTTETINAQNFASEIESIEGGGGGATLSSWTGTAVPIDSETTIENIYVNTSLSVDEVATLIQNNISLYPTYSADNPMGLICRTNNQKGVAIVFISGIYAIMHAYDEVIYFVYDSTGQGHDITDFGFSGWNTDFNGIIEINNYNYYGSVGYSSEIGNKNLKSLFSISPFTKVDIELSGEYTGETLTITENGTTDLTNDIANEKKIITNLEVNVPNLLQTLIDGRNENGGYYLCSQYEGDNVDFLADIYFRAVRDTSYMFSKCTLLKSIPQLDTSNVSDMTHMFEDCSKLPTIPLLDTSSVMQMGGMFYDCYDLTTIPQLNTSKVVNMSELFYNCNSLTTIPQLDTSKVTNMSNMFYQCTELTTIPQLNTSKVTDMSRMFYGCYRLTTIDITHFKPYGASDGEYFVGFCSSLTKLIIRTMDTIPTFGRSMFVGCDHFLGTVDSTYNPDGLKDGRIYVPDDKVEELKAAEGWSDFADIIVPLSSLTTNT